MKKPASVHIDIAEFSMTVMELSVEERSDWLLSLIKCLSYADPTLNEYGAKLLNEVETYREAERKRKEKYSDKGETRKDTERHGKTEIPKRDTTEQTDRTEQTVLKDTKKKPAKILVAQKPDDVSQQIWDEWQLIKKNKKQTMTVSALQKFIDLAKNYGMSTQQLIEYCISKSWASATEDYLISNGFKKVESPKPEKQMKVVFSDDPENIGYRNEK